jgi:hypothetical protein
MAMNPPGLPGCPVTVAVACRQEKMWVNGNFVDKKLPHWHPRKPVNPSVAPVVAPLSPMPVVDPQPFLPVLPPLLILPPQPPLPTIADPSLNNVSDEDDKMESEWDRWD